MTLAPSGERGGGEMRQSRYAGKKVLKKLKKHIDKEEKGRYTKQAVAVAGRRRGGEDLENCIEEKELKLLDRKVERRKRSQAIPVQLRDWAKRNKQSETVREHG